MLSALLLSLAASFLPNQESAVSVADTQVLPSPQPAPVITPVTPVETLAETAHVSDIPDFAAYSDVRTKKQEFFNFMLPYIREANEQIRDDRAALLHMRHQLLDGYYLDAAQDEVLDRMARRYRVGATESNAEKLAILLTRVDVVPASLVLAQSANETGWGTSRFARKANNMFGVWCFTEGCGLKPRARDAGLTHEVARYDNVLASVRSYIHTINTNPAYATLRALRAESRTDNLQLCGQTLAEGLTKYSARGEDYVREIQMMIRVNKLQQYTLSTQA